MKKKNHNYHLKEAWTKKCKNLFKAYDDKKHK
jgi:hypothetical protein